MFIFLCRNSASGTARNTCLSESFHPLWIKASLYPSILCKSFSVLNPSGSQQEKGNTLCWERVRSLTNLVRHTKVSYLIASVVFSRFSYFTYRNGLHRGTSKLAERLQVPQKVRTVLVWYLLLGIRILVYSCTGCGTSKIYLYLEDSRSSFSRVSLKSETKDACS